MQGLSAFRVAHCCPSFSGRSRLASPAPQQHCLSLGFQQRSSFSKCGRDAVAPGSHILKAYVQEEAVTEDLHPLAEDLPPLAGLPPLAEEALATVAEEDVSTNNVSIIEGPKVNVKFILEKKCHFGQRFNVVGNDPVLGNWEVEAAVPMNWTEGDIWIAEADVDAGKQVEFKFILTGKTEEELEWQPGSNRVFNTVEGISTLVVNEAWKSAVDDEVEEAGGESSDQVPDTTLVNDGLLVPADILEDATTNNVPKSEPETVPEIPLAELDVATAELDVATAAESDVAAATAVKTALGVDAAA